MPPKEMRTNLRSIALAMDLPSEVFPTPGGPTRQIMGPFDFFHQFDNRHVLGDAFFDFFKTVMIFVEDLLSVVEFDFF